MSIACQHDDKYNASIADMPPMKKIPLREALPALAMGTLLTSDFTADFFQGSAMGVEPMTTRATIWHSTN